MPLDKLFGYAFLISMPLSFLDKTTFVREYFTGGLPPGTGFDQLHWYFLTAFLIVKLVEWLKSKKIKSK